MLKTVVVSLMMVLWFVIAVQVSPAEAQITFSKDWRAGGKRSLPAENILDYLINTPCDQAERYSADRIRELIRVCKFLIFAN